MKSFLKTSLCKGLLIAIITGMIPTAFAGTVIPFGADLAKLPCLAPSKSMNNTCVIGEIEEGPAMIYRATMEVAINGHLLNFIGTNAATYEFVEIGITAKNNGEKALFLSRAKGRVERSHDADGFFYYVYLSDLVFADGHRPPLKSGDPEKQYRDSLLAQNSCTNKKFTDGYLTAVSYKSGTISGALSIANANCASFQQTQSGNGTITSAVGYAQTGWVQGICCN